MKILVPGAGRTGHGAAFDLAHNLPDVEQIAVAAYYVTKAEAVAFDINSPKIQRARIDVSDYVNVVSLMRGHDAAISCVNYRYNPELSKAAIEAETNFSDLRKVIGGCR